MWILIGLLLGILFTWTAIKLTSKNLKVLWYEYVLGALGLLLFLFVAQNLVGSIDEWEMQAFWMFVVILGLPSLLLMGIPALRIVRRYRAT